MIDNQAITRKSRFMSIKHAPTTRPVVHHSQCLRHTARSSTSEPGMRSVGQPFAGAVRPIYSNHTPPYKKREWIRIDIKQRITRHPTQQTYSCRSFLPFDDRSAAGPCSETHYRGPPRLESTATWSPQWHSADRLPLGTGCPTILPDQTRIVPLPTHDYTSHRRKSRLLGNDTSTSSQVGPCFIPLTRDIRECGTLAVCARTTIHDFNPHGQPRLLSQVILNSYVLLRIVSLLSRCTITVQVSFA